jgi:cyclopropane-fatty-acyl-phospholipid synthase
MTSIALPCHDHLQLTHARHRHHWHTLRIWRERFMHRLAEVRSLGYPDEFIRMWEWYLLYCEAGFMERAISTVQLVFDKPGCQLAPVGAR